MTARPCRRNRNPLGLRAISFTRLAYQVSQSAKRDDYRIAIAETRRERDAAERGLRSVRPGLDRTRRRGNAPDHGAILGRSRHPRSDAAWRGRTDARPLAA